MNQDLVRLIDSICRDKKIDRDGFVADLENAMASAIRKTYGEEEDAQVALDLHSGSISATVAGQPIDMEILGRIAAQTAKQVIIQKTRERERASIFEDFTERRGSILTGNIVRNERGNFLVNIGRTEGFLPRSEQIPGETHMVGERIRVLILEVRELPNQVKIILSRSHPEFILRLFELEVPEVSERIIEIKALAREAGYRTKAAVSSIDSKVDAVGACVGVRGSRIKNIVEELGGEKIDIVRWNESSQILIQNALKPAEVQEVALCLELGKATVVVAEDQLSLAIGKRGQNVRLAARLTGWDIDILTPEEYNKNLEAMERTLRAVDGVDSVLLDKFVAIGCVSVADIDEIGVEALAEALQLEQPLSATIIQAAGEEAVRQEAQRAIEAKAKAERQAAEAAEAAAAAEAGESGADEEPSAFVSEDEPAQEGDAVVDETSSATSSEETASEPVDAESTAAPETDAAADAETPSAEPDMMESAAVAEAAESSESTPTAAEPVEPEAVKDADSAESEPADSTEATESESVASPDEADAGTS